MRRMTLRSAITAIICSMSYSVGAYADPKPINVPAGDLILALETLAKQSGVEFVYQTDQVKGVRTRGVSGNLSPQDAVTKLLEGTSLILRTDETGAMLIAAPRANDDTKKSPTPTTAVQSAGNSTRLSQAETSPQSPAAHQRMTTVELEEVVVRIPEVLVVGSKILNADIRRTEDDIQPYVVFERVDIERSGATNIQSFLREKLSVEGSASAASQATSGGGALYGALNSFDLRGLGPNQTLILVDGRRLSSPIPLGDPTQPGILGIPLSSIERIEVLPTTASGIYGGSATGGVINIVRRQDYQGADVKFTYENTYDNAAAIPRFDFGGGISLFNNHTNISVAGSISDADELEVEERDFVQRARFLTLQNNPAAILTAPSPPLGLTTNIRSRAGTNLTLDDGTPLNSAITHVPAGYAGPSSDNGAAFVQNAGAYNLDLADTQQRSGAQLALTSALRISSVGVVISQTITDRLRGFLDFAGDETKARFSSSDAIGIFNIPASAPNNPFAQDIRVTTPVFGISGESISVNETRRAVAGLTYRFDHGWSAGIDYTWNRSRFSASTGPTRSSAAATAVSTGVLDVFRDTNVFGADFAPYQAPPVADLHPVDTTMHNTSLRASGPLWRLPAGGITLSAMLEERQEEFGESVVGPPPEFTYPARSQSVQSAYVEAVVPLFSKENRIRGIEQLEMQVAGRYDRYRVTGVTPRVAEGESTPIDRATAETSSTNPTLGLRYRPVADVMLRTSYGTGFLPPTVNQVLPNPVRLVDNSLGELVDPRRGNEPIGQFNSVTEFSGGNPNLEPEKSESWTAGVVWTPQSFEGTRLSIDWVNIEKTGNIASFGLSQTTIDNEEFLPNVVTRTAVDGASCEPVCPISQIRTSLINVAEAHTEAIDFSLDYDHEFGVGRFWVALAGTRLLTQTQQLISTSPVVDSVGVLGNLKWKGTASLGWEAGPLNLGWSARYFDSYSISTTGTSDPVLGGDTVRSQSYHDVFATWQPRALGVLADSQITIGVKNVFNRQPPFDPLNLNYSYSTYGDPRLASYYVSFRKEFAFQK